MVKHNNVIPTDTSRSTGKTMSRPGLTSLPLVVEKPTVELVKVTDEMKSFKAYDKLRIERTNKRHVGQRLKKAAEAEKEEKK